MRCRDARTWLQAPHEGKESLENGQVVEDHIKGCADCRDFERKQRRLRGIAGRVDKNVSVPQQQSGNSLSTERIMQAVQQQKQVSDQVAFMHYQQKVRDAHFRKIGAASVAFSILLLSSIPLFFFITMMVQAAIADKTLDFLNGVIDIVVVVGQYMQDGLTLITRNNVLFAAVACVVVVMIGMWLRLMRLPKEV
jgi:hypothetical protein